MKNINTNNFKLITLSIICNIALIGCINKDNGIGTTNSDTTDNVASLARVNTPTVPLTLTSTVTPIIPSTVSDTTQNIINNANLFAPSNASTNIENSLQIPLQYKNNIIGFSNFNNVPEQAHCPTPQIAPYGFPSASTIICANLPDEFKSQVPKFIQNIVKQYKIDQLDLFLVVERNFDFDNSNKALKINHWIFPNINIDDYKGNFFNQNFLMGTFSSYRNNIGMDNNNLPQKNLIAQQVNLHDEKVSPDNAHINTIQFLTDGYNSSNHPYLLTFYSVVVDPVKHKAAITLHVIIDKETTYDKFKIFNGLINKNANFKSSDSIALTKFAEFINSLNYSENNAYSDFINDKNEILNFLQPRNSHEQG